MKRAMNSPALYRGVVMHQRVAPRRHGFHHGVFFVRFPVDDPDAITGPLLSRNRWNLLSFHDADHGGRDGSPPGPWIRALLARHGLACADGTIWLQTFPRVLGYVFNPVSFWLAHDRAGCLRAVLAEVNNTFGEHHNYLVAHPDGRPIQAHDWLEARKVFHVSPFCEVTGHYRFRFDDTAGHCRFRIDYHDGAGPVLLTALSGSCRRLSTGALVAACLRYPWMTLAVILRIHYHALRLWAKRVPFFPKPARPEQETTR